MTYKLVFETDDIKELQRIAALIEGAPQAAATQAAAPVVKDKKAAVKKPEIALVETQTEMALEHAPVATEVSYEDVRKATLDLIKEKGKRAALDILDHLGVESAPQLKPEQYGEYIELVTTAKSRL